MEQNDGYTAVDTPFAEVGLLSPMQPDVALVHPPVADPAGNVAIHPPLLEGVWGALADAAAPSSRSSASSTTSGPGRTSCAFPPTACSRWWRRRSARIPAVCTPARCRSTATGRTTSSGWAWRGRDCDDYDDWIREWVLDVETQEQYLAKVGAANLDAPRAKSDPDSWRTDEDTYLPDLDAAERLGAGRGNGGPPSRGARHRARRRRGARWCGCGEPRGVAGCPAPREAGAHTTLTAEIGIGATCPAG